MTTSKVRGSSRKRPSTDVAHASGTGPDSVFVHAVRPGPTRNSGPLAVCGYPLRARAEDLHRDDRSFEERWLVTSDCCADCASGLGLGPADRAELAASEPATKRNWVAIGSVIVLLPMIGGLLARIVAVALR